MGRGEKEGVAYLLASSGGRTSAEIVGAGLLWLMVAVVFCCEQNDLLVVDPQVVVDILVARESSRIEGMIETVAVSQW